MKTKIVIAVLAGVLGIGFVSVAPALSANDNAPGLERVPVFIGFRQTPGPSEQALVRAQGGAIRYSYTLVPAIAASIPEPAIQGLLRNPNVTYIEPVIKVYAVDTELDNSWGVKRIGAGTVHDGGNKGTGIKVAIIDSGIDYYHKDLDANYKGGKDFVNDDDDPMDDAGHGTHVAGTVAAEDDGIGVVGVAPEAELYALKVLGASGGGDYADVIAALQWATDNGIQVTNNSYGSSGDPGTTVQNAFNNCPAVHVCAAGNTGKWHGRGDNVIYPARYTSCIAVAATDSSDNRAYFSSTGPAVEISAPGVAINSTVPGGGYSDDYSGTSMASPHVAGVAALIIASGIPVDVRTQLQETADYLGDPLKYGYGLVDADEAALPPVGNQAPVADFSWFAYYLAVDFFDLSYDSDGSIAAWNWDFGEGSPSTVQNPSHTYAAGGIYTVTLTVTDNAEPPATDMVSYDVTVTEAGGETPMHVDDIAMEIKIAGRNVTAKATVTILAADGSTPVAGATVYGSWTDATFDSDVGTTDALGKITMQSDKIKNASGITFTFIVGDVVKSGWIYDSVANVETSDSINVP